jgi:hypothetical protein
VNRLIPPTVVFAVATIPGFAFGDPPKLNAIVPSGVQRSAVSSIQIQGNNLAAHPRLIAPFPFTTTDDPSLKSDQSVWRTKIVVAEDVPAGIYPVRIQTDDGVSNSRLFSIGRLPQVDEIEDNGVFDKAQSISTPVIVEGQLPGADVDFFKFPGKKGQKIVVDAVCARIGSGVDPEIRLTTAARKFVASADDTPGLVTDARLVATLPEDSDYVVEISDSKYQGANGPIYRLTIGAVPLAEEVFPLGGRRGETVGFEFRGGTLDRTAIGAQTLISNTNRFDQFLKFNTATLGLIQSSETPLDLDTPSAIALGDYPELREPADPAAAPVRAVPPVVFNGRIDPAGDEDRYVVTVKPGMNLRIALEAAELGSAVDGQLRIIGLNDSVLATADDSTRPPLAPNTPQLVSPDPSLNLTVPSNTNEITVVVHELVGRGGIGYAYRLIVEPAPPPLKLALTQPEMNIHRNGTLLIPVTRSGDLSPLELKAIDLPKGLIARPARFAEGQTTSVISLAAAADLSFPAANARIVAERPNADPKAGPMVVDAYATIVYAKEGNSPTNLDDQRGLFIAPTSVSPVSFESPENAIELVQGFDVAVKIATKRNAGADGALAINSIASSVPPGLGVVAGQVGDKANEGSCKVNAAVNAKLGLATIGLEAKGKIGGKDLTFGIPAITLNVVRPASIALKTPTIEIKPGQTIELRGELQRKPPFTAAATATIKGLPAGLKADPTTVAANASEFTFKIVADPKAAAATSNATVSISFKINDKDYNDTPPATFAVKVIPAK